MYVILDENRHGKELYSDYSGKNVKGAIKVNTPPPSIYHKLNNSGNWITDTTSANKLKVINKLKKHFNKETETLIEASKITFSNSNGSIEIYLDKTTQQNYTALLIMKDLLSYPYEIWEGDNSLDIGSSNEMVMVCSQIMTGVEELRKSRKKIRDGFASKTTTELIELLREYENA
jgi:hypothetical protein